MAFLNISLSPPASMTIADWFPPEYNVDHQKMDAGDGKTWGDREAVEIYNPGRRISGRGWPRTVQLDKQTLGTLFYDLDSNQPGGPGLYFVRTPIAALDRGKIDVTGVDTQ